MGNKKRLVLVNPGQEFEGASAAEITNFPPLSLGAVAALTPRDNWDVVLRDANIEPVAVEDCDLVGVTGMTAQANHAYKIADEYRRNGIPVVMGGIHATFCPEEALNHVDSVVIGEAETVWKTALQDVIDGKLQRIYKGEALESLAGLPPAAHHLFSPKYTWWVVQTTRGCPLNCEYCTVTAFNGKTYRKRPISEVLDEIAPLNGKFLFFADDNLFGFGKDDESRFIDLCEGMIKRGIKKRWVGQVTLNFSESDAAMEAARKSGCICVFLGIESPSESVLRGNMGKMINVKYIKNAEFIKRIHNHGLLVMGAFIIGNDEDTPAAFDRIFDYQKQLEIDMPVISFLTPYPGTRLTARLQREGRIPFNAFPQDWIYYNNFNRALVPTRQMTTFEVNEQARRLSKRLYSFPAILRRVLLTAGRTHFDPLVTAAALKANLSHRNRHSKALYRTEKI